ncbi:hypothetical protein CA54_45980 [Symmachiella macrocystis]|uniref:Knr4/Smi1-like domain-containing protein n=1 Tax=Symmachiella macrocystis TaxID=2527985 RepID=A0A5C6BCM2_9PLAN|nr:SMI1/KNR4 family protein [Symmachiella macrocystis]TWU09357.1 hypothetical protein CA54_45980 [Symmachiella macrocystis]
MTKDAAYWNEARQRVIEMRCIDSRHNLVFGSDGHKYQILKRVSEERLLEFESKNELQLPAEYRSFLTSFGAGGAGPGYGMYDFRKVESAGVERRFHLTDSQEWPDDDDDPLWDLPGLLNISTSGCSHDWWIEINGPQPGTMWVNAGDRLLRSDSFGTWYGQWLDRVEWGLQKFKLITDMIASEAKISEIAAECGVEPRKFTWDGLAYLRFEGIPGCYQANGNCIWSYDVGTSWIA